MNKLIIEINQPMLEHFVPAFENADEDIFRRMGTFFDNATVTLEHLMGDKANDYIAEHDPLMEALQEYVCIAAAYQAIPQLDLVLNESGFGVVSNQNLAPASRDRVNALREELRTRKSTAWCDVLSMLLHFTSWKESDAAKRAITSLLYCPNSFNGNMLHDGKPILMEEFALLRPQILVAEVMLAKIISEDLYKALVNRLRLGQNEAAYELVTTRSYAYLFASMQDLPTKDLRDNLIKTVEALADSLPEYRNSEIYRGRHSKKFENDKDSGIFFFG